MSDFCQISAVFASISMISLDFRALRNDFAGMSKDKVDGGDDEADALWRAVTRDVAPMPGRGVKNEAAPKVKAAPLLGRPVKAFLPARQLPVQSPAQPPSAGLDRRTRQKIRKGKMAIERTLDLHGLSQDRAHAALQRFVLGAHTQGVRLVLVITGKGRSAEGGLRDPLARGEGVLRRRVPQWLAEAPLTEIVLKVHAARPQHGGDGALYVYLRRVREG